jgi:hypothetical protein
MIRFFFLFKGRGGGGGCGYKSNKIGANSLER